MSFERTSTDMGRMAEELTPPGVVFSWTNRGDKPLVITRMVTTCGCVTTDWNQQPVLAGEQGAVTVNFRPKGHPGSFSQRIFVYTQLSDKYPSAILNLTGTVIASGQMAAGYSITMGALQLSRQRVTFDGKGGAQQANIACHNAGTTTLRLGYDKQILPPGFSMVCEPETLEPATEGRLIIRYQPQAGAKALPAQFPLFIKGLGLPPSKSSIRILIDNE